MCTDITFCSNTKCEKTECRRHMSNVTEGIYSWCQFSDGNGDGCNWMLGKTLDIGGN